MVALAVLCVLVQFGAASDAEAAVTVSGIAEAGQGAGPWAACGTPDGIVAVSVGGAAPATGTCAAGTGAFSIAGVPVSSVGDRVAIYLAPPSGPGRGVRYQRAAAASGTIAAADVTDGFVRVGAGGGVTSAADVALRDAGEDIRIPIVSTGSDITTSAGIELRIDPGATLATAGDIIATSIEVDGVLVGGSRSVHVLSGSGTGPCSAGPGVQRPLCVVAPGRYLPGTFARTRFVGTAASDIEATTYAQLELLPTGGSPTYQLGPGAGTLTVAGSLLVGAAGAPVSALDTAHVTPLSVRGDVVVAAGSMLGGSAAVTRRFGGSVTGDGAVSFTGGAVDAHGIGALQRLGSTSGPVSWTFPTLTLGNARDLGAGTGATSFDAGVDVAIDVEVALDGSTFVGGRGGAAGAGDWIVRRLTPAGALDTSWGGSGVGGCTAPAGTVCVSSPGVGEDLLGAIDVAPDGTLLTVGTTAANGGEWHVLKWRADGTPDAGWGGDAVGGCTAAANGSCWNATGAQDAALSIVVDASGAAWVGGYVGTGQRDLAVRRYLRNGTLDTAWGAGGSVTWDSGTGAGDGAVSLAIDTASRLYVAGSKASFGNDWVLRRYNSNGMLDGSFNGGMVTFDSGPGSDDRAWDVVVDSTGNRVLVAGQAAGDWRVRAYRTSDGVLDATWGTAGSITWDSGGALADVATSVVVERAGSVVVAGSGGNDAVARRYTAAGVLDGAWGGGAVGCASVAGTWCWSSPGGGADVVGRADVDAAGVVQVATTTADADLAIARATPSGGASVGTTTLRLASGGTGDVTTTGDLHAGVAGDPAGTIVDVATANRTVDVNGSFDVAAASTFLAAPAATLSVADDFTNLGTFTAGAGTVQLDSAATSTVTYAADTQFGTLRMVGNSKAVTLDHLHDTVVTDLVVTGGSCGAGRLDLRSTLAGDQFALRVLGTSAVRYVDVRDSNAVTPLTAFGSNDAGGNSGWSFLPCTTVSGTVGADELGTPWTPGNGGSCDGTSPVVRVVLDGTPATTVPCDAATGAWSAQLGISSTTQLVTAYLDTNGGARGVTATVLPASVATVTGIDVIVGRARLHGSAPSTTFTYAELGRWDATDDPDVPVDVTGSNVLVPTGTELVVGPGVTWTMPAGTTATLGALQVAGTVTATTGTLTLTNSGTSATCTAAPGTQEPLCIQGAGTATLPTTTRFAGTTSLAVAGVKYTDLRLEPSAGSPTYTLGDGPGNHLRATTLVLDGGVTASTTTWGPDVTVLGSTAKSIDLAAGASLVGSGAGTITARERATGAGTVNLTGGTFVLYGDASYASGGPMVGTTSGSNAWHFNDVVFTTFTRSQNPMLAPGGSGVVFIDRDLSVTSSSFYTHLRLSESDRELHVGGSISTTDTGFVWLSDTAPIHVGGDVDVAASSPGGTPHFHAAGGTVVLTGGGTQRIDTAPGLDASQVDVRVPGTVVEFGAGQQHHVADITIPVQPSCATPGATIRSTIAGVRANLAIDSGAIGGVAMADIAASPALFADSSTDLGGNAGVTFLACPPITASGTALLDEAGTPATVGNGGPCNGVTANVAIVIDHTRYTTTCSATTGAWSVPVAQPRRGASIVAYLDTNGGANGVTYAMAPPPPAPITGITIVTDRIVIDAAGGGTTTAATVAAFDSSDDIDIPTTATSTSVTHAREVLVEAGATYAAAPSIQAPALQVDGTWLQPTVGALLTLTSPGTSTSCAAATGVQIPLCVGAGSFTAPDTVAFAPTTGTVRVPPLAYETLRIAGTPTSDVQLGTAAAQAFAPTGLTIDSQLSLTAFAPSLTVNGDLTMTATSSKITAATSILVNGGATMQQVQFTGGTFEQRSAVPGQHLDAKQAGTYANVVVSNATTSPQTSLMREPVAHSPDTFVPPAIVTMSPLRITGDLTVGRVGDPGTTKLHADSWFESSFWTFGFFFGWDFHFQHGHALDVDGDLVINDQGTFAAPANAAGVPSQKTFQLGGDLLVHGLLDNRPGVDVPLELDTAATTSIVHESAIELAQVRATQTSATIEVDDASQLIVQSLQGAPSCGGVRTTLRSTTPGTRAHVETTATGLQYLRMIDISAEPPTTATDSLDGGGNANVTFQDCSSVLVSGTAQADQAGLPWTPVNGGACDGSTQNVAAAIGGRAPVRTTCNPVTGAFTLTVAAGPTPEPVVVWLDTNGGARGAVLARSIDRTTPIPGLQLVAGRYGVSAAGGSAFTHADLDSWDSAQDADVPLTATVPAGTAAITIAASGSTELGVGAGASLTIAPRTGNVLSADRVELAGTLSPGGDLLVTGSGTATACAGPAAVQMPLCMAGGTLAHGGTSTVRFTSTATTRIPAMSYGPLVLAPTSGTATFTVGAVAGAVASTGALTIDAGALLDTSATSPSLTTGPATVTGTGALLGSGSGTITVGGNLTGTGTVDLTGGQLALRMPGATSFGTTTFAVHDLELSNRTAGALTATVAGAGGTTLQVRRNLTVGRSTDAANTTLNALAANRSVDVDGDVTITSRGVLSAPSTGVLTIAGNFTRTGTFTHNAGTVAFDGIGPSTLTYAAATTFGTIRVNTPGKTLEFDHLNQTNTTNLNVIGSTCAGPKINLNSDLPGLQFTIASTTSNIVWASIRDAVITTPTLAKASIDAGNNGANWSYTGCSTITVSGTVHADAMGTPWNAFAGGGCDGVTPVVAVSFDGEQRVRTSCDPVTGTWSTDLRATAAGRPVLAWLDTDGSDRGGTVFRNVDTTSPITGIQVVRGRMAVQQVSAPAITSLDIDRFDQDQDSDVPVRVTAGALTAQPNTELHVRTGATFAPAGAVTTTMLRVSGTYTGATALTLAGGGTRSSCTDGPTRSAPLCIDGGTFTAPTTTTFAGPERTHVAATTYAGLVLAPAVATAPTYELGTGAAQSLTATTLTIGNGAQAVTASTTVHSPTVTINGALVVNASATLSGAGSGAWTVTGGISGGGVVNRPAATFEQRVAANQAFGPSAGAAAWTFDNLVFSNSTAVARTITFAAAGTGAVRVLGTMQVGIGTDAAGTVATATAQPMDFDGDIVVTTLSTYTAGATTLAGNVTSSGTFAHTAGTLLVDGAATSTTTLDWAAATSLLALRISTPGKAVAFDTGSTTTITTLTTDGGTCGGPQVQLMSLTAGVQAPLTVTTASVTYASLRDLSASAPRSAFGSTNLGNNTNWTISGCVTVSGTAHVDDAGTVWSALNGGRCDGFTPVIAVVVSGGAPRRVPCNPATGAWTTSVVVTAAATPVLTFYDANSTLPTHRGAVLAKSVDTTSPIAGVDVVARRYRLLAPAPTAFATADIGIYDVTQDSDLVLDASAATMSESGGSIQLVVDSGATLTGPTGAGVLSHLEVRGTYTQAGGSLTLNGSGTGTACTGGVGVDAPLCVVGGTTTMPPTVTFTGSGAVAVRGGAYTTLALTPTAAAAWTLGTSAGDTFTTTTFTIGGTSGSTFSTTTYSPNVIASSLTLGAGTRLLGSGTGTFTLSTVPMGSGTADLTAGTVLRINNGGAQGLLPTDKWSVNDLVLARTVAGMGDFYTDSVKVYGDFIVGRVGDPGTARANTVSFQRMDIDDDVLVNVGSEVLGGVGLGEISVGDDITVNGTFTGGNAVIILDSASAATLDYAGPASFGTLRVETPGKVVNFDEVHLTTVSTLVVAGAPSCAGSPVTLQSIVPGNQFDIAPTTANVSRAALRDSNATVAAVADTSTNLGNNSANWTIRACSDIAVSGRMVHNEAGSAWTEVCDGTTPAVAVSYDGHAPTVLPCNSTTGAWSLNLGVSQADRAITAWYVNSFMYGSAATVTRNANTTSAITGLDVTYRSLRLRSESGSNITNAFLATTDSTKVSSVPFTITAGAFTSIDAALDLIVAPGVTYAPGGNVSTSVLSLYGSYVGTAPTTLSLGNGGSGACAEHMSQVPICGGGTFTAPGTVAYSGCGAQIPALTYTVLTLTSGFACTFTLGTGTGQTITSTSMTVTGGLASTSAFSPNIVTGSLTLADGKVAGTGTGTLDVNGALTSTFTGGLDVPASAVRVRSAANVAFGSTGTGKWTMGSLELSNAGGAAIVYSMPVAGCTTTDCMHVLEDLRIGRAGDTAGTELSSSAGAAHGWDVDRDVSVRAGSQLTANSSQLVVGRDVLATGTVSAASATLEFDGATSRFIRTGAQSIGTLLARTPGQEVQFDDAATFTITTLTVTGAASCTGAPVRLHSDLAGSPWFATVTTANVSRASIRDSQLTALRTATASINEGGNVNWAISSCAVASGTVLLDESGTPWTAALGGPCDGTTPVVRVVPDADTTASVRVPCDPVTGAWSAQLVLDIVDRPLIAYVTSSGSHVGAVVTRNASLSSFAAPLDIVARRVLVASETATSVTGADLATWDGFDDTDIPFTSDATDLQAANSTQPIELAVASGTTLSSLPNTVRFAAIQVNGTFVAPITVAMSTGGTGGCSGGAGVQRPLCIGGGGSYVAGPQTTFQIPAPAVIDAATYNAVTIAGSGGVQPVTLGSAAAQSLVSTQLTLTSVAATNTTWSPTLDIGQVSLASSTLGGAGTGLTRMSVASGSGYDFTAGTQEIRRTADIAITAAGRFHDLRFSNPSGVLRTYTVGNAFTVTNLLSIGKAGDAATTRLQLGASTTDVDGNLVIEANGDLVGSASGLLRVGGDFTRLGTYTHANGTVELDGAGPSTLTYAVPTSFGTLRVATSGKVVRFDHLRATTVANLVATGTSCTDPLVALRSDLPGSAWTVTATASTIRYATIGDSTITAAAVASGSVSEGGNGPNWTFRACTTISGIATDDATGTPWTIPNGGACDGVTANVAISFDGAAPVRTPCDASNGAWTATVDVGTTDRPLMAWLDSGGGDRGATVTRSLAAGAPVAGVMVTHGLLRITSHSGSPVSNADVGRYDADDDPDLPVRVTNVRLETDAAVELRVEAGATFAPAGIVDVGMLHVLGTIPAGTPKVIVRASGTTTSCAAGIGTSIPLCVAGGGSFATPTTMVFMGEAATLLPAHPWKQLALLPTGATSPTYSFGTAPAQSITIGDLFVGDGLHAVTASTTSFSPTLDVSGSVTVAANATLGGSGTGTTTIRGDAVGAGAVAFSGGPVELRASLLTLFGPTGAASWTFPQLVVSNSAASATTVTVPPTAGGDIHATGSMQVGRLTDTANVTLDAAGSGTTIDVDGSLDITARGTFKAPTAGTVRVADDILVNGPFAPGSGLVILDGAPTSTITGALDATFHGLRVATPSKQVILDHLRTTTVAGTTGSFPGLTVDGGSCATRVSIASDLPGTPASLAVTGSHAITASTITDVIATSPILASSSVNGGGTTNVSFTPCGGLTISVTSGTSLDLGVVTPGADVVGSSAVHVDASSTLAGYDLHATDASDTASFDGPGPATIDDWTGTSAAPTTWPLATPGPNGWFGATVLSATGGRLAKWGAGSSAPGDIATNAYLGLRTTNSLLHTSTSPSVDDIALGFRAIASPTNAPGAYSESIVLTAIARP